VISVINNGWLVSLASIVITVAVTPTLQRASDWVRSRRGALTGTYLALSQVGSPESLIAEIIRCRHVGDRLKGTIQARAEYEISRAEIVSLAEVKGTYRFTGRVRSRQVLLNYWSPDRASQNGGTMTMAIEADGLTFLGIWCGTATTGQVTSGQCTWIKCTDTTANLPPDQLIKLTGRLHEGSRGSRLNRAGSDLLRLGKLRYMASVEDALKGQLGDEAMAPPMHDRRSGPHRPRQAGHGPPGVKGG
jgi:hypothetical protein